MTRTTKMVCPFGHNTRLGQLLCPTCGEHLIDERRKEDVEVVHERRRDPPAED